MRGRPARSVFGNASAKGAFPGPLSRSGKSNATTAPSTIRFFPRSSRAREGAATGSITFPNAIGGPGRLRLTAPNSSANQGRLVLQGANTYFGGTLVAGGNLVASGANATFGTGSVLVSDIDSPDSTAVTA